MKNFTCRVRMFLVNVVLYCLFTTAVCAQQVAQKLTASNGVTIGFYEYKPSEYNANPARKYPLIIFLHGLGERGNGTTDLQKLKLHGIPKIIDKGHKMSFLVNGNMETFLVLSPQLSASYGSWQQFYTEEMLRYATTNLQVDTNRIYLTGLSLGGGGTWSYASASLKNAQRFAAIAPVCGTCSVSNPCNIANSQLPVWAFHASNDNTVGVNCTHNAITNITKCNPAVVPLKTIYPTGGHAIWDRAYSTDYSWQQPNMYEWFLGQNKSLAPNLLPIAQAGNDMSITTQEGMVSLSAKQSKDPDGTITRYLWKKISGPIAGTIQTASAELTSVIGLTTAGSYSYELTVVDNRSAWSRDTVSITVSSTPVTPNKSPIANAGLPISMVLPQNSTQLNASASLDPDGTISKYTWTKIAGPSSYTLSDLNAIKPVLSNLIEGTYQFELTVTDNNGSSSIDSVTVQVNKPVPPPNQRPVARAGADLTIVLPQNNVTLDGTGSLDADGFIATYNWKMLIGAAGYSISSSSSSITQLTSLMEGIYRIQLTVSDDQGLLDSDTIEVQVIKLPSLPNKAPVAIAGIDQEITLPTSSVTLNGSASTDSDGKIDSYYWTIVSGISGYEFSNPRASVTTISKLSEGRYIIALEVRDNGGLTSRDSFTLTVKPAPAPPNMPPVANAGRNQIAYLPDPFIELDGSGSFDPDGSIKSYQWSKTSGPGAITIVNSGTVTPRIIGVEAGKYVFRLLVTDQFGASDHADVVLTVLPPPNKLPVADAGRDTIIAIPATTGKLNGLRSFDPDGKLVESTWRLLQGNPGVLILNPNEITTDITNMLPGEYYFELLVKDDQQAASRDTVQVLIVDNFRYEERLNLYPNPASNELNLECFSDSTGSVDLTIYNLLGLKMMEWKSKKESSLLIKHIYVSELNKGIYFLEIRIGPHKRMIRKFIKR